MARNAGRGIVGLVVAGLVIAAGLAPSTAAHATGTASITGVVTVPATEDATKVQVIAVDNTTGARAASAVPDAAGNYTLGGLAAGAYDVLFDASGTATLETEWWNGDAAGGAVELADASAVSLTDGQNAAADASLGPSDGSMQGTLNPTAPAALPREMRVCAVRQGPWSMLERCTQVSATGTYTLASLRPGGYKLGFIFGQDRTLVTASGSVPARGRTLWWKQESGYASGETVTVGAGPVTGLDEDVTAVRVALNLVSPYPALRGAALVGQPLTVTTGIWPPGVTPSFIWYADGVPITGAAGASFTPTSSQAGKTISVDVHAPSDYWISMDEYMHVSMTTPEALPQLVGSQPTITGTLSQGYRVTAHPGSWPSGSALRYQWFAQGVYISGSTSTSPTLLLTKAQVSKQITVKVTATKPGYAATSWFSLPTLKVMYTSEPVVAGAARVGVRLAVYPYAWEVTSFTYQWYANGVAVPRATGQYFVVTTAQRGKTIKARVTGHMAGFATISRYSASTARVP